MINQTKTNLLRRLAGRLSHSRLMTKTEQLWIQNRKDWFTPLTKVDKVKLGLYLICSDYYRGSFPPSHEDLMETHKAEIDCDMKFGGVSPADYAKDGLRKPFFFGAPFRKLMAEFLSIHNAFERTGILPPKRILELGCGHGWASQFLSSMGFDVVATTISGKDIDQAKKRTFSLQTLNRNAKLKFMTVPMESADSILSEEAPFDAVFAMESLHHAHSWQQTLKAARNCLTANGSLFLFNEPNLAHTFISYRVSKLLGTHEIGLNPSLILKEMKMLGFNNIKFLKNPFHFFILPFSLMASK